MKPVLRARRPSLKAKPLAKSIHEYFGLPKRSVHQIFRKVKDRRHKGSVEDFWKNSCAYIIFFKGKRISLCDMSSSFPHKASRRLEVLEPCRGRKEKPSFRKMFSTHKVFKKPFYIECSEAIFWCGFVRKELIRQQVPLQPLCYDFTPVNDSFLIQVYCNAS